MPKLKKNSLSRSEFEQNLRLKKFSPIYLFYGKEDLLIEEFVDLIIQQALDENSKSFNLDIISNGNIDAKDLVSLISAYPLMSPHRVVIVKDIERVANKEFLLPIIERPVSSTIAVFITEKPDFRLKLYKAIQENGVVYEFKQLYDNEIQDWIKNKVASSGKSISIEAIQLIQSVVAKSLREIQNEIDKLLIFVGDKDAIDINDVATVVGLSRRFNIFELQKAIGKRDMSTALEILENMLNAGEDPIGIVVMLTKYFQKMLLIWEYLDQRIKKEELIQLLHLSPQQLYFLEDEINSARMFSPREIQRNFSVLLATDEKLKSTDVDVKLLLTLMIYHLIGKENLVYNSAII